MSTPSSPSSEHPINSKNWPSAYPSPRDRSVQPLRQMHPSDVRKLLQEDAAEGRKGRRSVLVVDVRRADCESMIPTAINLPAHTFHASLHSLIPLLRNQQLILFHCSSSRGRGPRCAGWYADALEDYYLAQADDHKRKGQEKEEKELLSKVESVHERVGVLVGGIKAWEEEFGARPLEERGRNMKEARDDVLDLRTIPM